nr:hypothetical protein CFP56_29455 [Quercus suber]
MVEQTENESKVKRLKIPLQSQKVSDLEACDLSSLNSRNNSYIDLEQFQLLKCLGVSSTQATKSSTNFA